MTPGPYDPHISGYTRVTMVSTIGYILERVRQSFKRDLSSDRPLQLENVKSESVVIEEKSASVNQPLKFVLTARHHEDFRKKKNFFLFPKLDSFDPPFYIRAIRFLWFRKNHFLLRVLMQVVTR